MYYIYRNFQQILFRKLLSFYVQSSLHVGLAVVSLMAITHLEFDLTLGFPLVFFVFCSTVLTYNFIKYATAAPSFFYVIGWRQKSIRTLSYFCGFVCFLCCFYLPAPTLWVAIGLGVISFLYVFPLTSKIQSFRHVKHLKIIIVAVVWASTTAVLPLVTFQLTLTWCHLIFWCVFFFWTLATMVPFEIRDIKWDDPSMRTLPHSIGIRGAKVVGFFSILCVFFIELWYHKWTWSSMIGTGLVSLVTLCMLYASKPKQSRYYAAFWVEALPVLWVLVKWIESELRF